MCNERKSTLGMVITTTTGCPISRGRAVGYWVIADMSRIGNIQVLYCEANITPVALKKHYTIIFRKLSSSFEPTTWSVKARLFTAGRLMPFEIVEYNDMNNRGLPSKAFEAGMTRRHEDAWTLTSALEREGEDFIPGGNRDPIILGNSLFRDDPD